MRRLFLLIFSGTLLSSCTSEAQNDLDYIELPPGFKIEIYAEGIKNARSMTLGDKGTVFVGSKSDGSIYAIRDENNDHKADKIYTIASNLNSPNGVAFKNGSLYVAEISRVIRFDDIENKLSSSPKYVVVNDQFPTDEHHGWKYIKFGPDGKLYIPVGAPCNICESEDKRYASMMRMNADGSNLEVFASGIRNTVGFAWHPVTKELWFTDNGRDWLGENKPNDELNRAPKAGMHFGYPYCHDTNTEDPKYGEKRNCSEFTPPVQELGPHVAALGMIFYTGKMFPKEYQNQVFIAEHGSWNKVSPIGYRITMVKLEGNKSLGYEVFAEGWLQKGGKLGRPVDLLQLADGSILVSDDYSDRIYRISYQK